MVIFRNSSATSRARRTGRRRGLLVGAAIGSRNAKQAAQTQQVVQPQPATQPEQTTPPVQTINTEALEQLAQLHIAGILTDAEFEEKKRKILGLK